MCSAGDTILLEKLEDLKRLCERLELVDSHIALFLLRHAFAIPKLTYFLRSAPCFYNKGVLKLYDVQLKEALQSVIKLRLSERAWDQASLPVSHGGLGIRCTTDIALPA